ncbi:MAG TPA: rRNA maturation RNase YbeY [Acidimicrobiia bacterium]|nr:rRNA maturation RNase YbeY [Acidimicrobiia bacterium]
MNVFLADEQDDPIDAEPLRRLAEMVLDEERFPDDTEVTLLFVGEDQIATYNDRFMQRQGATDVLAFPIEHLKPGVVPERRPGGPPLNIGDVVIAPSFVRAQAEAAGVPINEELSLMVVHGLLHLLGYDHQEDKEADEMEDRERQLLARAGRLRP